MSDSKHFRIILDLSRFFHDHRRVARLFIKNSLKTIEDLQNRISQIFEINGFYLSTGGHFLPISEDIRILNNDETVCVTPDKDIIDGEVFRNGVSFPQRDITKSKQQKRVLDDIPEEFDSPSTNFEVMTRKKKKLKRRNNLESPKYLSVQPCSTENQEMSIDIIPDQFPLQGKQKNKKPRIENCVEDAEPRRKKSNKKDYIAEENASPNAQEGKQLNQNDKIHDNSNSRMRLQAERNSKSEEENVMEKEICQIDVPDRVSKIKNELKQKANEYLQGNHSDNGAPGIISEGFSGFKTVLPKLQSHIKNCDNLGRLTTHDTLRLSRHVDTPMKIFSKYHSPQRITDQYLAKTKINIVRIDVVNKNTAEHNIDINSEECNDQNVTVTEGLHDSNCLTEKYIETEVAENTAECNINVNGLQCNDENVAITEGPHDSKCIPENYVKTEVVGNNVSENKETYDVQIETKKTGKSNSKLEQNEASNYTKIFLDQKRANAPPISGILIESVDNTSARNTTPLKGTIQELTSENIQSNKSPESVKILETNVLEAEMTLDISSLHPDSASFKETSFNSTLNMSAESNNNEASQSKKSSERKFNTGVGSLIELLRESDSLLSQDSDGSSKFVTKRKRIRHRKRKSKKDYTSREENSKPVQFSPLPLIMNSSPNIHIKFEDNSDVKKNIDSFQDNALKNTIVQIPQLPTVNSVSRTSNTIEISSVKEIVVLSDENEDPILENKFIFGSDNILKAPLMGNKLEPKVGDVIAFKILKLSGNYSPQISNYIVGKVEMHQLENKTVYLKILSGQDELLLPSGRLSVDGKGDIENSEHREFAWNEMLEPKLLYP